MEVDLVVDRAGKLIPVEVKLSAPPSPQTAKGIENFHKDFSHQTLKGHVIHPGDTRLSLSPEAWAERAGSIGRASAWPRGPQGVSGGGSGGYLPRPPPGEISAL